MAIFASSTITALGVAAIADGVAGATLAFTSVTVGSGTGVTNPSAQTALVSQQMILGAPNLINNNAGQVTVNAVLDSANVGSSFYLSELGVWGTVNGGSPQLWVYSIAQTPYDFEQTLTGVSDQQTYFSIPVQVGNVAAIDLTVTGGGTVYNAASVTAGTGIVVTPVVTSGITTSYIVSAGPTTPQVIIANTTLYVSTTGNNSTAVPNDITHPWASIQGAVNYLSSYSIAEGVAISILLAAGTYSGSAGMAVISHPNSSQIFISGPVNSNFTFSVGSITGSSYSWSVQLTSVSSTTGMTVGGYVNIWSVPGISNVAETLLAGMFPISAISGSTVTITVPYYGSSFPSMSGFTTGSGTVLTALMQVPQNEFGLNLTKSINTVQYIGFVPAALAGTNFTCGGISLSGSGLLNVVGVYDFRSSTANYGCSGFSCVNGSANLTACTATICDVGINISNGTAACKQCGFSHNILIGVWPIGSGSAFSIASAFVGGNAGVGISVSISSSLICQLSVGGGTSFAGSWYVSYNGSYGVFLQDLSTSISSNSSCVLSLNANTTYDLAVTGMSISNAFVPGSPVYNQAVNTLTASGYIA